MPFVTCPKISTGFCVFLSPESTTGNRKLERLDTRITPKISACYALNQERPILSIIGLLGFLSNELRATAVFLSRFWPLVNWQVWILLRLN